MRFFISLATIFICTEQVTRTFADDPLFSKLQMSSVYERSASDADTNSEVKKTTAIAKPRVSLVGRWSCGLEGGEAVALKINADATFVLLHLKAGRPNVSRGKATRSGNRLTLAGDDGTTLSGSVENISLTEFQWVIRDAADRLRLRLAFEKAPE